MRWILRLAGWATLLAVPAWGIMAPYQKALGAATSAVLSLIGWNVEFTEVALAAPFDLAVYSALCLASVHASWRRRRRALLLGIPLLIAGEVAGAILVIAVFLLTYRDPAALEAGSNLTGRLLESIPWINASALWLAFLGAEELPQLAGAAAKRKAPPLGGRLRRSAETASR